MANGGDLSRRRLAASLAPVAFLAACGPDTGQVALCERVLYDVAGPARTITILDRRAQGPPHTITLVYRRARETRAPPRTLSCRFAGGRLEKARLELVEVIRDDGRPLSTVSMVVLRRRLGLP